MDGTGSIGTTLGAMVDAQVGRLAKLADSLRPPAAEGAPPRPSFTELLARASTSASGSSSEPGSVDALWKGAQAKALADGYGPGDSIMAAFDARDAAARDRTVNTFGLAPPGAASPASSLQELLARSRSMSPFDT